MKVTDTRQVEVDAGYGVSGHRDDATFREILFDGDRRVLSVRVDRSSILLTRDNATSIIPILQVFAETGRLPIPETQP